MKAAATSWRVRLVPRVVVGLGDRDALVAGLGLGSGALESALSTTLKSNAQPGQIGRDPDRGVPHRGQKATIETTSFPARPAGAEIGRPHPFEGANPKSS
jgi:hypothetical protein